MIEPTASMILRVLANLLAILALAGVVFVFLRLVLAIVMSIFGALGRALGMSSCCRSKAHQGSHHAGRAGAPKICRNVKCGRANIAAARYCAQCGTPL